MRKRVICTMALAIVIFGAIAAVAAAGGEKPIVVRAGNLIITLNGGALPKALPKHKLAPVSVNTSGEIATVDGNHPPALREVILDTGKTGQIRANDFPTCKAGKIEATTTEQAESNCRDAIVGRGRGEVEVEFPESNPFTAKGPLVIFNGGERHGKSLMLIHAYASIPAPTAIVTRVVTTKEHKGVYRLHSVARIPVIAGGSGSPTAFSLRINRKGYLMANCDNGHFSAHATLNFQDGTSVSGSFERPCTGIG